MSSKFSNLNSMNTNNHFDLQGRSLSRTPGIAMKSTDIFSNLTGRNDLYPNTAHTFSPTKSILTQNKNIFYGNHDAHNSHNEFDSLGQGLGPESELEFYCDVHLWDPEQVKQWLISNHLGDLVGTWCS